MMGRREFITLLGGAVAWPLAARAQHSANTYRIAIVRTSGSIADMTEAGDNPSYSVLFKELRRLGYIERHNLIVQRYSGEGHQERYTEIAHEVVRTRPHLIEKGIETPFFRDHIKVFEKTVAEMEAQLGKTTWLASDMYTLADAEITPYIERVDRLGLAGLWESRPRVADWFARIKARPSYKGIADYPPTDYDDTGRDGLKDWPRIKQLMAP